MAVLTGKEIIRQVKNSNIQVTPYLEENVGANSLDLRLGKVLVTHVDLNTSKGMPGYVAAEQVVLDTKKEDKVFRTEIPDEGIILKPGIMYLASTMEEIFTDKYVPFVDGRSSFARKGAQVHITAGVCEIGFRGTVTLEIKVTYPIRVYPGDRVCQVYYHTIEGEASLYRGRYQGQQEPTASRMHIKDKKYKGFL